MSWRGLETPRNNPRTFGPFSATSASAHQLSGSQRQGTPIRCAHIVRSDGVALCAAMGGRAKGPGFIRGREHRAAPVTQSMNEANQARETTRELLPHLHHKRPGRQLQTSNR
jgi:hypothetical protein